MKPLKIFYYKKNSNFGDLLNEFLVEEIFGRRVVYADPLDCEICAIGSILDVFLDHRGFVNRLFHPFAMRPSVTVWGSGFIKQPKSSSGDKHLRRQLRVQAVRGKHTLQRLQKITGEELNRVALGDPGLLASKLIKQNLIKKEFELGIVPHYTDQEQLYFQQMADRIPGSRIIDICAPPMNVLQEIAACKVIVATAMHALIVADSLGIPNQWLVASESITGGRYKFDDYYSAYDLNCEPFDLRTNEFTENDLQVVIKNYRINPEQVQKLQNGLIASFPRDI